MRQIFIGSAGWSIPRNHAEDFPGEGSHLRRYGRRFNCAEINSCFHREHKPETYAKWAAAVAEDFRFSVKAPKTITHTGRLSTGAREKLEGFLRQTSHLGNKRGPVLLQIPPSLHFNPVDVGAFFDMFRRMYEGAAALEPRHESWFTAEASEVLCEFGIARVAADPAIVAEAADPAGARELVYFRLHGSPVRYRSAYSDGYLERLAGRMPELAAEAAVWCIFDNTAAGAATGNAMKLAELLGPE
jgi:uncharacterized protein YecE (DUF72 family)